MKIFHLVLVSVVYLTLILTLIIGNALGIEPIVFITKWGTLTVLVGLLFYCVCKSYDRIL